MRHDNPSESKSASDLFARLALIAVAAALMGLLVAWVQPWVRTRLDEPARAARAAPSQPQDPIAFEAYGLRSNGAVRMPPDADHRRGRAHTRTLATFQALRPYPGGPPRIPHGLTADEFRTTGCRSCHERGGYAARFEAYVPVTPHPERTDCLQCHVADAAVVGIELPDESPDALCRQCHAPGYSTPPMVATNWRPASWPAVTPVTAARMPPVIPHPLSLREDCLACHDGPAAVAEIRTTHPERTYCLQCHATIATDGFAFKRAMAGSP